MSEDEFGAPAAGPPGRGFSGFSGTGPATSPVRRLGPAGERASTTRPDSEPRAIGAGGTEVQRERGGAGWAEERSGRGGPGDQQSGEKEKGSREVRAGASRFQIVQWDVLPNFYASI